MTIILIIIIVELRFIIVILFKIVFIYKVERVSYLIDFVHFSGDERSFLLDDLPVGGVLHVFKVEAV